MQDPLNYSLDFGMRTHHTNQDKFDVINPDNMKQAATVIAALVYQTAMMDEKIPRKTMTAANQTTGVNFNQFENQLAELRERLEGVSCGHEQENQFDGLLFKRTRIFTEAE
jgi:hypothetical protein